MRRVLLPLLAVLAAAVLVWLWLGERSTPVAPDGPVATDRDAAPGSLTGDIGTELKSAQSPAASQPQRVEAGATEVYVVDGRVLGDGAMPLTGARILAHRASPDAESGVMANMMSSFTRMGQPSGKTFALMPEGEPLAQVALREDGTFTIEAPERHLLLTLDHTHYALTEALPVHVPDEGRRLTVGPLQPYLGAYVHGRVVGTPDDAVATLQLVAELDPMSVMHNPEGFMAHTLRAGALDATCDSEDAFEFRAVWPTAQVYLLLHEGETWAREGPFPLTAGETREVVVHARNGATLAVQVRDADGDAVAGSPVSLTPTSLRGQFVRIHAARSALTDTAGECTLAGLPDGDYRVRASADGFVAAHAETTITDGAVAPVVLTLERGALVSGKVVDATGAPIADAGVAYQPEIKIPMVGDVMSMAGEDLLARGAEHASCRTDADGRFTLTGIVDRGKPIVVVASREGFVGGAARDVAIGATDVTVTLARAGRVTGTVVDAETKTPIAEFTAETIVTMFLFMERPTRSMHASDSPDGTFALEGVPPGKVKLKIAAEGYADAEQSITVRAEQDLDVGTVALQRQATIRGRVVADSDGTPVRHAIVRRKQGGFSDHPMVGQMFGGNSTRTDERGEFTLTGLRRGGHILLASAEGYASGTSGRLRVQAGETLEDVEVRLGHGGTVTGRLLLAVGEEYRGWHVIPASTQMGGMDAVEPESDGSFRLENLDPGRYEIQAFNTRAFTDFQDSQDMQDLDLGKMMDVANRNSIRARCVVTAGETVDVTLDGRDRGEGSGTTLVGRVLLGARPMDSGWVEVALLGGEHQELLTGIIENGAFEMHGVRPGKISLQVRRGMLQAPVGEPKTFDVAGGRREIELSLPGGAISGRVVHDRTGDPLRNALVRLTPTDSANTTDAGDFGFVITDADGRFSFDGLGEGTYQLVADEQLMKAGGEKAGGRLDGVRVEAGQHVEGLLLRALPAAGVSVNVTDEAGGPQSGAIVIAVDAQGQPVGTMPLAFSDTEGRAFLAGLPAGQVRIVGRVKGLAPGYTEVREVLPDRDTSFDLVLRRGPRVTVRIQDDDGRTLRGAHLSARREGGPWISATVLQARTLPDGAIDLGPMLSGSYELLVVHPELGAFKAERSIPPGQRSSLVLSAPQ